MLANAVADAYVVEKLDARFEAAKRASAWLSDRLVDLRKQLRDSEEAVADFRKEHGFLQSKTNVTLNQQQLSELNAKLLGTRAETADKKARVDLLNSIEENGGNVQSLPDLANSPTLQPFASKRAQSHRRRPILSPATAIAIHSSSTSERNTTISNALLQPRRGD